MNRSLALLCSLFLTLLCLAGCENKSNPSSYQENSGHSIIDSAEASTASSSATTVASEPVSSQKIPYVVRLPLYGCSQGTLRSLRENLFKQKPAGSTSTG